MTSRASYPNRALACQIEAWTGSQMTRVRIPAVRCVTAAGLARVVRKSLLCKAEIVRPHELRGVVWPEESIR